MRVAKITLDVFVAGLQQIAAENTEFAVCFTLPLAINLNEGCPKSQGSRIASTEAL